MFDCLCGHTEEQETCNSAFTSIMMSFTTLVVHNKELSIKMTDAYYTDIVYLVTYCPFACLFTIYLLMGFDMLAS